MCGDSSKTTDTAQTSTTSGPQWLTDDSAAAGQQASSYAANNPYQGYTGPTQGAFGSTFGTAEDGATARAGTTDPNFSAGTTALGTLLGQEQTDATQTVPSLMSQYTGAALQPTLDAINRTAATQNTANAQGATAAGAFGDTGYGTAKSNLQRDTQQNIGNATASAYNQAYSDALSTHNSYLSNLASGVGQASGLGSSSNASATNLEALLGSLGSTTQSANQTGINTAINVNNSNQMGQLTQDSSLANILASLKGSSPTTTNTNGVSTTTQPDNTGWGLLGSVISAI